MRFVKILLLTALFLSPVLGFGQATHFVCNNNNSINNATVIIPANAVLFGFTLAAGDEVAAFTPTGVCAGMVSITAANTAHAFNIYGHFTYASQGIDNPGFENNEALNFRLWKGGVEYSNVYVKYTSALPAPYNTVTMNTTGLYQQGAFYVLGEIGLKKLVTVKAALHGLWNTTTAAMKQPTAVTVELRSGTALASATVVSVKPAIIGLNGEATANFGDAADGQYFVVVRAPGYLPLGSTSKLTIGAIPASYDFTDNWNKAAGNLATNFKATVALSNSNQTTTYAMRAGDFDANLGNSGADFTGQFQPSLNKTLFGTVPALTALPTAEPVAIYPSKLLNVTVAMHGLWLPATKTMKQPAAVIVELRSGTALASATLVSARPAIIRTNGTLTVDFAGVADGQYFVVIRSAGYLPIGTTSKVTISSTEASYNFTDNWNKAAGNLATNFKATLNIVNGDQTTTYVMRAGDFDANLGNSGADFTGQFQPSLNKTLFGTVPALTTLP